MVAGEELDTGMVMEEFNDAVMGMGRDGDTHKGMGRDGDMCTQADQSSCMMSL